MIQFIHTADIHFGMENYGRVDPVTGIHSRLLDFEKSLNSCVDYAIKHNVDLFVFSGDAYKTPNPSPTHQKLLLNCFFKLYKAGIPISIVVGNHDNPLSFGKANALDVFAHLPLDGFTVFSKPGIEIIQTKNGPVQIVGIPWPNRHNVALKEEYYTSTSVDITEQISAALASIIAQLAQQLDPTLPAILSGHLTVANGTFSGSEKKAVYGTDPLLYPSQLAIAPFDYVALGHLHRFQELNENGIPIVYSGSIDRIDFGERKEAKGFVHGTIDNKTTHYKFVPLATRPFVQIEVDLQPLQQTEQILAALKLHDITNAIVKIIYTLPADTADIVDVKKIQMACSYAQHLIGIFPIRQLAQRTQRSTLHAAMDFQTALETYVMSQEGLKKQAPQLLAKIMQLQTELELESVSSEQNL